VNLLRWFRYARRYRNWREIVREQAAGCNPTRVVLRDGTRFEAPPDVNPTRAVNGIYFKHCYTPSGFEVGEQDVVVDVGANIGVFSVFAASRSRARIVAIEPHPANVEFLLKNVKANGHSGIEVVAAALTDRRGSVRLRVERKGVMHRLVEADERARPEASLEVPGETLDELVVSRGVDRIDLLKMDCEGAEGRILRSLAPAVLQRIGRLAMEFHDDASPLHHDELQRLLEERGFTTRVRWDGRSATGFLYAHHQRR
jgi:FkbM family methyltransferase